MIRRLFQHGEPDTIRQLGLPRIKAFLYGKDISYLDQDIYCLLYELVDYKDAKRVYFSKKRKLNGYITLNTLKNLQDMSNVIELGIAGIILPPAIGGFLLRLYRMVKEKIHKP